VGLNAGFEYDGETTDGLLAMRIRPENMPPPRIPLVETSMEQTYRKITDQLRVNRQQCAVICRAVSVHHHTATNLGDTEVLGSVFKNTKRSSSGDVDTDGHNPINA
jgi:hypothetical protein